MQRIIMGNLIFPLRFRSVSYRIVALVILHWYIVEYVCMDSLGSILLVYHTKPSQSTAAVRVEGKGTHVIEFPTANLICTELKLYGAFVWHGVLIAFYVQLTNIFFVCWWSTCGEEWPVVSVSHSPIDCASAAPEPISQLLLAQLNGLSIMLL